MSNLNPGAAPEGRMVSVAGREFHLIEMGEGDPVFFLHGGGPGCTAWSDFAVVSRMFAKHFRCYLPDLLQYGQSDKQVIEGPMWNFHADTMAALMDELGVERADFVCNS